MVTRARRLLWAGAGFLCATSLAIGSTPLVGCLTSDLEQRDPLGPSDAIVVLLGGIQKNGQPGDDTKQRLLYAYELLGRGYAPRLIIGRPRPPSASILPTVRRQTAVLRLVHTVEESGQVSNTRDEATETAQLARSRGWRRIIVVTQPSHSRRARAAFQRAAPGLSILSAPCPEGRYDLRALNSPSARHRAFNDWLREATGMLVYRLRGWV